MSLFCIRSEQADSVKLRAPPLLPAPRGLTSRANGRGILASIRKESPWKALGGSLSIFGLYSGIRIPSECPRRP